MDVLKRIEWNSISLYRSQLMGLAAIWVLLFHSQVSRIGWGGVEIFIFVSALGCYSSLSRNGDAVCFYKKRLQRILPTYLLILGTIHLMCFVLATMIPESAGKFIYPHSFWDALCFYTTLGFWIPKESACCYEWYVPTIIFFYFCMPYCKRGITALTHRLHNKTILVILTSVVFSYLLGILSGLFLEKNECDLLRYNLALNRIPTLAVGLVMAPIILKKFNIGGGTAMLISVISLCVLVWFNPKEKYCMMTMGNALMLVATPGLCLWLGLLFKHKIMQKVFGYLGKLSLEIYLLHIFVIKLLYGLEHFVHIPRILFVMVLIALTIAASDIVHRLIGKLLCKD